MNMEKLTFTPVIECRLTGKARKDRPKWQREKVCFYYELEDGAIAFDNRQAGAARITKGDTSLLLAREMFDCVTSMDGRYLSGRTVEGLARELRMHYYFCRCPVKFLREHAIVTNIGGLEPTYPGYDDNAEAFESAGGFVKTVIRYLPRLMKR